MSGSAPQPVVPGPGDEPQAGAPGRSRRGWWWLLVAVLAIAVVTILVAQPWQPVETEPTPTATATVTPSETTAPSTPPPSASVGPPGADAVFDPTTATGLFVTPEDLVSDVPAAEPGVQPLITTGTWGLPPGSNIEPDQCVTAVTVVQQPPTWYDMRMWGNTAFTFDQEIVLLPDPAAAREAFRALVTTVDACPRYSQVNEGVDGATWTAEPAIEGQGVYPSIVQEITHAAEGTTQPTYRGHMLVGNTIVTWTAESLATGDQDAALATLGDPESLSAMVQGRAQSAVQALG